MMGTIVLAVAGVVIVGALLWHGYNLFKEWREDKED